MLISLIVILLNYVFESVIGSIVGPSLIFYVESVGGTADDYGKALSAHMLGITLLVTFYGNWVDSNGNKYQAPFACTFILGIVGSLIYFLASVSPKGFWAVNAIIFGRFIQGMGAAGKSLIQCWIATAVPHDDMKTALTVQSMAGNVGTFAGPVLNILVAEINTSVAITSNYSIEINPYNSIGLFVLLNEVLIWMIFALFLKDPPRSQNNKSLTTSDSEAASSKAGWKDIVKAMTHFDVSFPLVQQFLMYAMFQLWMTAQSPVAANMLGWTPVEISQLSVVGSVILMTGMALMAYLSTLKITDFTFIFIGNAAMAVAGLLTYFWWRLDTASVLTFALPVLLVYFFYPFSGPANQSSYTKAVFTHPETADSVGLFQSIFTQAATIAGIVGPTFVTKFILRDPEDIDTSSSFETTPWALYIPIASLLMIVGLFYEEFVLGKNELGLLKSKPNEDAANDNDEVGPDETSNLVTDKRKKSTRQSIVEINQVFSRKYEVDRRMSTEIPINGVLLVNPFETASEAKLMKKLAQGKEEWEHLLRLDEEMEEMEMKE